MKSLAKGFTFTHERMLDPDWTPGPGQRYADAPKAKMIVTRVTGTTVYFGYEATGNGGFSADRAAFEGSYLP